MAALAMGLTFTSCSHDFDEYTPTDEVNNTYNRIFIETFGQPAANHNWGFDATVSTARAITRSFSNPTVPTMNAPYDGTWVTNYLATAKEPNSTNIADNYDNSSYARKEGTYVEPYTTWYAEFQTLYPEANYGWNWNQAVAAAKAAGWEHFDDLFVYNPDTNYVLNFKITGTWDGGIGVAGSEGLYTDGTQSGAERTIVVTGTWNITEDQRIGSLGRIIIADGGTVNVASGKMLNMVNQAQLVILRGGKLTGEGTVEVNNGNAAGRENYNGGTVDVAVFNNNFGKFFNYGKFLVTEYQGGAKESNFYNHHLANIDHFGIYDSSTANARIFNACQFYVQHDARIRNYEGIMGSALIVGGQLMFSSSEDGTSTPTYVGLAAGALVKCGTLYNNGTSWEGPTSNGYAALSTGSITFLNWQQDHPEQGGSFANNIYVQADTWTNVPGGNGNGGENAAAKFAKVQNKSGNGNVTVVEKGTYEVIPADNDFELGVKGCTPGFNIKNGDEPAGLPSLHVMAEDLSATEASDFDFNDVVIDVFYVDANTVTIKLLAAGGTLPLRIAQNDAWEVHKLFNVDEKCMVNTGTKYHTPQAPYSQVDGKAAVELTLKGYTWSADQNEFAAQVRDQVKLEVKKDGIWHEIRADQGQPAAKIATPVNIYMKDAGWYPEEYRWTWEKQGISNLFNQYVSNPSVKWYTTK